MANEQSTSDTVNLEAGAAQPTYTVVHKVDHYSLGDDIGGDLDVEGDVFLLAPPDMDVMKEELLCPGDPGYIEHTRGYIPMPETIPKQENDALAEESNDVLSVLSEESDDVLAEDAVLGESSPVHQDGIKKKTEKRRRKRRQSHRKRKRSEHTAKSKDPCNPKYLNTRGGLFRDILGKSLVHATSLDLSSAKRTSQAFISTNRSLDKTPICIPEVSHLVNEEKWTYIENDENVLQLLVDKNGRIFAAKLAHPQNWKKVIDGVERAIDKLAKDCDLVCSDDGGGGDPGGGNPDGTALDDDVRKKRNGTDHSSVQKNPKRCPTISMGNSFGTGQKQPGLLKHSKSQTEALKEFHNDPDVQRWSKHTAAGLAMVFPAHYKLYHDMNLCLLLVDGLIKHIFPKSPFPATSVNLGPRADSKEHRDYKNLLFGLCALGIFGSFDHKISGHMLLHEAKVIIELRQGDVIFIPSAAITHSNSGLQAHEVRRSIVQYFAGGLFRWAWQDHKLAKDGFQFSDEFKEKFGNTHLEYCWQMFPTLGELEKSFNSGEPFTGTNQIMFELTKSMEKHYKTLQTKDHTFLLNVDKPVNQQQLG